MAQTCAGRECYSVSMPLPHARTWSNCRTDTLTVGHQSLDNDARVDVIVGEISEAEAVR